MIGGLSCFRAGRTPPMSDPTGMDARRRAENMRQVAVDPSLILCKRCDGTGNELFSMYRACEDCGGIGVMEVEASE